MKKVGFILFCLVIAAAFANNTAHNGQDFTVFWTAARAVLDHGTAYSVARDGFMTFKYPPWILPFFVPFGFFSLGAAKILWGLIEAISLLFVVRVCRAQGPQKKAYRSIIIALLLFLPIWNVHGFDGQISIVLTAMMLFGWRQGASFLRFATMCFGLSAKVFTLFPVLAVRWNLRLILKCTSILAVALLFSVFAAHLDSSGVHIVQEWLKASGPGYNARGELTISVSGFQSQGIPSLLFRVFHWPGDRMGLVYGVLLSVGALAFFALKKLFGSDRSFLTWTAWMAATATIQPLAGFHVFSMAFPLSVVVLQASESLWPCLAIAAVTLITEKLGSVGWALQFISVKSIGVWVLIFWASRLNRQRLSEAAFRSGSAGT